MPAFPRSRSGTKAVVERSSIPGQRIGRNQRRNSTIRPSSGSSRAATSVTIPVGRGARSSRDNQLTSGASYAAPSGDKAFLEKLLIRDDDVDGDERSFDDITDPKFRSRIESK